jgi:DNA-binding MarR family transcriptional regulator
LIMSSIMQKLVDHVKRRGEPEDVLEAIHRVMHLYRSQRHRLLSEAGHGLTHMDGKVLGFFARQPGATLSELVLHAGRDKGQLARLVGGLRERGLLEARVDETDRRNQRLYLTLTGEEAQQALRRQNRRIAISAARGLSDEDKRQLLELLARVHANLEGNAAE